MARYPVDPNYLIRDVRAVNEMARTLRDEGWKVEFKLAENDTRIWLQISRSAACDPPAREDAE